MPCLVPLGPCYPTSNIALMAREMNGKCSHVRITTENIFHDISKDRNSPLYGPPRLDLVEGEIQAYKTFACSIFLWNYILWCLIDYISALLATTKQLYEWYFLSVRLSVCLSVCPSHFFDYVPIIVSSWNFQELSPKTRVTSMQNVKARGQRSRS